MIVPFKKTLYEDVLKAFARMALIDCATEYTLRLRANRAAADRSANPGNRLRRRAIGGGACRRRPEGRRDRFRRSCDSRGARRAASMPRQALWPDFSDGRFDAVLFTRSLHHVDDLAASVEAAAAAVRPGGRVIVEDFMAEGARERSTAWFGSFVVLLDEAGLLDAPTPYLLRILGRVGPGRARSSHHELHASGGDRSGAPRAIYATVSSEPAAYYFRYLLPGRRREVGARPAAP